MQLNKLRALEQCKYIFNITHNNQKSNSSIVYVEEIHNYYTRNHSNIHHGLIRTNKGLHSPLYQAIKEYNSLPVEIRTIEKYPKFKKMVSIRVVT